MAATELHMVCSGDESSSEQGEVAGLSEFMAEALKVVSAPDAFLQKEQVPRRVALPCFSFNQRGVLVKTMSRKHSSATQQSLSGTVMNTSWCRSFAPDCGLKRRLPL